MDDEIKLVKKNNKELEKQDKDKKNIFIMIGLILLLIIGIVIKITSVTYKVYFRYNEGDKSVTLFSQPVKKYRKINLDQLDKDMKSVLDKYQIEDWYLKDSSNPFDFDTRIKESIILYAKAKEIKEPLLTINNDSLVIQKGSYKRIDYTLENTDSRIIWTSNNNNNCKVDNGGKVTGVKKGSCIIKAKVEDLELEASIKIEVTTNDIKVSLKASKTNLTVDGNNKKDDYIVVQASTSDRSNVKFNFKTNGCLDYVIKDNIVTVRRMKMYKNIDCYNTNTKYYLTITAITNDGHKDSITVYGVPNVK